MPERDNKEILQRAIETLNRGDLEGYLRLYDSRVVLHGYQGVEPGIESVRQFYQGFTAAFSDLKVRLDDVLAEGDRVAARFTTTGTSTGPLMGMPPTGKQVTFGGITILRFAGGKCVERWSQSDFLGLMQQLGAVPASA
ncbi:MAG: ester cyclase [Chloroflexi bacterium]|nr:ester cyclase [Chloroflexota bacterium]